MAVLPIRPRSLGRPLLPILYLRYRHHDHDHTLQQKQQEEGLASSCKDDRNDFDEPLVLQTLCEQGHLDRALHVLSGMDAAPSSNIYLSLLKACNKSKALTQAKQIHAHLYQHCIPLSGFLGDYLVMTLAKCGAIEDAREISWRLPHRTVYSWTAMISAYTECGLGEEALRLHKCMLEDGIEPDAYTFVSLFKACGSIQDLDHGKTLHADARKKGFASDVFVGNTLVSMYGKCGAVAEAEDVFKVLPQRNTVSWGAMLSAYVEQGQGDKALQLYRQMLEENLNPDWLTSVISLQACGVLAEKEALEVESQSTATMSLEIGQALHADACRKGFTSDVFFGSTLVSMYGKCGSVVKAEHAFDALCHRNIVSWNAMLSAYVGQGKGERALWLYKQMRQEGMSTDQLTLVFALQACGILAGKEEALVMEGRSSKVMCMEIGQALHADALKEGFTLGAFLGSALLSMYGKCRAVMEAECVFGALTQHNIVSWNAMLSIYIEWGQGKKALRLYRQLQEEEIRPDELTTVIALQACAILADKEEALNVEGQSIKVMSLEIGHAIHSDARRNGFALDLFVGNTLVSMYAKCGAVVEAEHVFGALSHQNLVSWNVMLSAYIEQGQGEKALQLFSQMQKQCVTHNDVTLISIMQACSTMGSLEVCKMLHFNIVSAGYDQIPSVAATVIHAYGSCASMVDALAFFDELFEPHIVSWNACISGHAGEGNFVASLHLFEKMKLAGIMPDEVTFTSVLSACSHAGLVNKGLEYFESMSKNYDLTLDVKHYGSMLDLFGRVGDFKRVENMLGRMQMQADLSTWLCLLGACRKHGNLKLAKQAFNHAVILQPRQAPAYVLMSNIYVDAGLQECATKVENLRLKQGSVCLRSNEVSLMIRWLSEFL